MKLTTKLGLKKPDLTDYVNIGDLNDNMDILDEEVEKKVDKVSGKSLSTNDYTTTEKNKLSGIEVGANKYTHPAGTNPHGTTKTDVGLSNVDNVKQASKVEFDAHKADYEYQVGTVVGRQIRVTKQSSTNIVKFKLSTDIIKGTQITISLNGGSTNKPLMDSEGLPITELEKGFMEVIENAVNFTFAPKGAKLKYLDNTLIKSLPYSNNHKGGSQTFGVNVLTQDSQFVYFGGGGTQEVWKVAKPDMSFVSRSESCGYEIKAIDSDDEFIYCTGSQTITKIRKSDMSIVAESAVHTGSHLSIAVDNEFIYWGGPQFVTKLNKSNLIKVVDSTNYGSSIDCIAFDGEFIYCGGKNTRRIWKLNKTDMSKVAESPAYTIDIKSIAIDSGFIYFSSGQIVIKSNKSNLAKVAESASYGFVINTLAIDDDFIYYAGGISNNGLVVFKTSKPNMAKMYESPSYGNVIRAVIVDKDYVYYAGNVIGNVVKANNFFTGHYKYKSIALKLMEGVQL